MWIISSSKGYKVNPEYKNKILDHFQINNIQNFYESSKYRPEYILKKLITSNEGCDIFDLSESLYVSTSTVKADLRKIIPLLDEYQLTLSASKNIYSVEGMEKNKRKLISSILMKESHLGFTLKDVAEELISENDLDTINTILKTSFRNHAFYVNDYAFYNLITCLIIAVYRIRHQCPLAARPTSISVDKDEFSLAREIFLSLTDQLDIDFTKEEIFDFSLLIESQCLPVHYDEINDSNILSFVNADVLDLVNEIISRVNENYYIDLNIPSFYTKFALHLHNLLFRARIGQFSSNPLTQSMKESCPLIYEISVFITNLIDEKENVVLDENEIAFIAIHIGSVFKTQNPQDKLSVLLVCPDYYDVNQNLQSTIMEKFSELLHISKTVHGEEKLTIYSEYDLIITTIDIPINPDIPIQKINIIPTKSDWENISDLIENILSIRKQARIRHILSPLFDRRFFAYNAAWISRSEVINQICKIMASEGYIETDYSKFVFEREAISSTAFGNIAIPHSLNARGIKTGIFVSLHKKPLKWGEDNVSIVLLLSINPNDQYYFSEIFSKLTEILSSQENIMKLSECKTFNEFLDTLSKLS